MSDSRPTLAHRMEYLGWMGMSAMLGLLTRGMTVRLAGLLGRAAYDVLRLRRRTVDENLAIAFGATHSPAERRLLGRRTYQSQILTFFEFLQTQPQLFEPGEATVPVHGLEHARPYFGGKPVIMVTGHLGNWEGMAYLLEDYGIRMVALAKPLHNPLIQRQVLRQRARHKSLEIVSTRSSLKLVADSVREGKWVTFVADQDARKSGIFVDYFGRPASTAQGPALFAWKLGIPILPVFCVRRPTRNRTLEIIICPPIVPDPSAERDPELERLTRLHVAALEQVVREHPQDYFWLHRRWKTRQPSPKERAEPTDRAVPEEE